MINKNEKEIVPIEFAQTLEIDKRKREVQYLINIVEPDPEYQPYFLSDEASIFEVTAMDEEEIDVRLKAHFGKDFQFPFTSKLWKAIDEIKQRFPNWPESLDE